MRNWWGNSADSLESAEPATSRRRAGGHKGKASPFDPLLCCYIFQSVRSF